MRSRGRHRVGSRIGRSAAVSGALSVGPAFAGCTGSATALPLRSGEASAWTAQLTRSSLVQLGRLRCVHPDGRSPAGASVSAMFATTTTGVPLARKARAWLELGAAREDALPCRARGGRARHQPSVPDYVATGIAQARAVVARRSVGRRQTSRRARARPDPHQALLVKLGAPAFVQNAGGEPAPHEGTLVANMLVGHG
jgi:hypothetical protein